MLLGLKSWLVHFSIWVYQIISFCSFAICRGSNPGLHWPLCGRIPSFSFHLSPLTGFVSWNLWLQFHEVFFLGSGVTKLSWRLCHFVSKHRLLLMVLPMFSLTLRARLTFFSCYFLNSWSMLVLSFLPNAFLCENNYKTTWSTPIWRN